MIAVQHLNFCISGQTILRDISFSLEDGQNLIILGRSGSGKTMLIKTLMGFFKPEKGSVIVDGINVHTAKGLDADHIRQSFAMVFQNSALLDSFTVLQNVALPLYEREEKDSQSILDRVLYCLKLVGMEESLNRYPSELSGGMKKRVGIARALVYAPRYIIFDEPVSGLDPITSSEVLYYIKEIIHSVDATAITITHDIRALEQIGNQVLFLEEGESIFFGTIPKLHSSDHPVLKQFLNS